MVTISRLIFLVFSFFCSFAYAYERTAIAENGSFKLTASSVVEVYTVGNNVTVWSNTLGAGSYRCNSSLWGSDPAPGKTKACRYTLEPTCPEAGSPAGSFTLSSKSIISVCNDGCQVVRVGDPAGFSYGGPMEWVTKFEYSGATCVPGEPPETDGSEGAPDDGSADPTPPQDNDCYVKGLCPFNYNGRILCTKCDSKEGTSNQSESSSGSGTDSSGNPAGDTGTTTTTKETTANCTNGSCNSTTTTVVTNPDGSTTTTTETESTPQADFCKSNPGHIVCKGEDEGTFGGSCASDFQCTGDPVQCAQAREVAKLRCVFEVSPDDPLAVAGGLAMNGELTPSGHPGAPGSGISVNVMDEIDTAPAFGSSGNCISDRTFSVVGMSLTLPFASMCPYFNMIGNVFLSCCYLVAGFIVFRR